MNLTQAAPHGIDKTYFIRDYYDILIGTFQEALLKARDHLK